MRSVKALTYAAAAASIVIAGGLASATSGLRGTTSFEGLGLPPLGTESRSRAVSNNAVVAGVGLIPPDNSSPTTGYRAIRWTEAGWEVLGTMGGGPYWFSSCQGVSADGSVMVGGSSSSVGQRAFRWTAASGMVSLGTLRNYSSSVATDVSSDGSIVVGYAADTGRGDRAFRWANGSMANLGTLKRGNNSRAWAVSGNGSVVAGISDSNNGDRAFRWTSAGMQNLGPAVSRNTSGGDISGNGLVVVGATGNSSDPVTSDRAFRWTASTGMVNLGTLQTGWGSWASGTNDDGSMVVGSSGVESHPSDLRHAFLWTPALGMVDLNTYLPAIGVDLTGWTLVEAKAVSPDGRILAGWGLNPDGDPEGWIVHLEP